MPDDDAPPEIPTPTLKTIVLGPEGTTLAHIQGAVWPPIGSVFELGRPNRDAVVKDVRLRLQSTEAMIVVRLGSVQADKIPAG
jgi:hypothetical protein